MFNFPITIQKLELHVHCQDSETAAKILSEVKHHTKLLNKIMATEQEVLEQLDAANAKADKVISEVQALRDEVNTTPGVPESIVERVNSLANKLQQIDDINPDAEPPAGEETQP